MENDQKPFGNASQRGRDSSEENLSSGSPLSDLLAYLESEGTHAGSEESVAGLVEVLGSQNWKKRAEAARRLVRVGDVAAIAPLVVTLKDEQAEVRAFAARALGNIAVEVPVQPLLAILNDDKGEQAKVRAAAAWALGEIREAGEEVPMQPLQAALEDKDEDVRAAAARALGKFGNLAPVDRLKMTLLEDPDWHPREIAALALGNIGGQLAIDALNAASNDESTVVNNAVAYALEKLTGGGPPGSPPTKPPPSHEPSGLGGRDEKFESRVPPKQSSSDLSQRGIEVKDTPPMEHVEGRRKEPTLIHSGNIEFIALEPSDLGTVPVVAQALDNQWVPRSPLAEVMAGASAFKDVQKEVEGLVRGEYIRALINGKQVIVNRAFLYNNAAIFQDYWPVGEGRDALKMLLQDQVIVPFLMTERTPDQQPRFGTRAFQAWQQLCEEVRIHCLRFSWDDENNLKESFAQLARRFHDYAMTAISGDFESYIKDLGVNPEAKNELRKRLGAMARMCLEYSEEEKYVTRDELYKAFVTAGEDTSERLYDPTKPFAGEIKQLIDLAYNANLSDALGGYLLTPADSLPRIALQEWQRAANQPEQFSATDLVKMLRRQVFSLINEGLYLKSMHSLRLQDVVEVRKMDEWNAYIVSLEGLLKSPLEFVDRAAQVYQNYAKLADRMTTLVVERSVPGSIGPAALTAPWNPTAELMLNAAGASVTIAWTSEGPVYKFAGEKLPHVGPGGAAAFSARFNIGTSSGAGSQADLFTSLEFMKGTLQDAREQWKEILSNLKSILGRQEGLPRPGQLKAVPTINDRVAAS